VLNLALDTATRWGRFALADGGNVLVYRPHNVEGSYADALLPVVQEMLAEAGRAKEELAGVGVTVGPGSFTGVRIGVATAKALAWGLKCRLTGVNTLEAMAAALLDDHPDTDWAVPVLDARRREVFAAVYAREGAWVRQVVAPAAAAPDAWWPRVLEAVPGPEAPVYGGDGARLLLGEGETLRPELAARGTPALRRWLHAHPATARSLAAAMGAGAVPETSPFTLVPEYLRVSDAEINRRVDLTPQQPSDDVSAHRGGRPGK
jgi:tRNA threonylcarbamoyladenosine biosynthesis protein TsaB